MADIKHSGYKEAAQEIAFSGTQTLNALANNEWTDLSDAVDNTSKLFLFADFELELGSVAFTGAGSRVNMYLLPSVDGTNYPNWTGNVTTDEPENEQYFVGSFYTSQANEAQAIALRNIALPPGLFKIGMRNVSGVALATGADANELYYRGWHYQTV